MQKIIKVSDLKPGMYLFKICGSWVDHSFWKEEFILNSEQINLLKHKEIQEVVVDFSKSHSTTLPTYNKALFNVTADIPDSEHSEVIVRNLNKTSFYKEILEAKNIIKHATSVVQKIFTQARLGQKIDSEEVDILVNQIHDSISRNTDALISLLSIKNKDSYTYMHSIAVCALMILLSKKLGHDEQTIQESGVAGILHDIGKVFIPIDILNKPGKLTDSEFLIVQTHASQGYELLKNSDNISSEVLNVCLYHHEKYDGTGYPRKLKGDNIPIMTRMASVCDTYDALTSDKPYQKAFSPTLAIKQMSSCVGQFDPTLFRAFISILGIYPVGSIVKLNNGQIGVVVEKCEKNLLTPKVKTFFSSKNNLRIPPTVIDLSQPNIVEKIESYDNSFKLEDILPIFISEV